MARFVFRPPPLHSILLLDSCSSSHILQYCCACRLADASTLFNWIALPEPIRLHSRVAHSGSLYGMHDRRWRPAK